MNSHVRRLTYCKEDSEQAAAVVVVAEVAEEEGVATPLQSRILQRLRCLSACSNSLTIKNVIKREIWVGSHLSVIPEDASVQGTSPARSGTPIGPAAPVPPWITNPPIDYAREEWSGGVEWRCGGLEVRCCMCSFSHPF